MADGGSILKPNVSIPLAASFNTRGLTGYTTSLVDRTDQIKTNSIYEPVQNSMTGQGTLYLAKRPGVDIGASSLGASTQASFLVIRAPSATVIDLANTWLFNVDGSNVRVSSTSTNTTITAVTAAGFEPTYADHTHISGTEYVVLQVRGSTFTQEVWYSSAIATWTQITDGDFTGLTLCGKMEFLDGYAFVLTSLNRIVNSDLNSLANWTANNYITKQITQDIPLGLARLGSQIIAFGEDTMEVFVNAGNATGSPLQTVKPLHQRVGLKSPNIVDTTHYYATLGGKLYFVGREGGTLALGVFAYDGQRAHRISTPFIDKIIRERQHYSVNTIAPYQGRAAIAIGLNSTTDGSQRTLIYYPDWNEWFEWTSAVWSPVNSGRFHIGVGTNLQHKVYFFTTDWQDDTTDYSMIHQFQLPSDGNHRKFMPMCGIQGDTARSASSLSVQFSDDDGVTWSTARTIDMTSLEKMLTRCGAYKGRRMVRLTHTANLDCRMEKFLARVN